MNGPMVVSSDSSHNERSEEQDIKEDESLSSPQITGATMALQTATSTLGMAKTGPPQSDGGHVRGSEATDNASVSINPVGPTVSQNNMEAELEAEVNTYFSKLYTSEISVQQLVDVFLHFGASPKESREYKMFNAMLRTLFFECRYFPKYPTQELLTTAELFGKLIKSGVFVQHGNSLVMALRCVHEALKKNYSSKMFKFGVTALQQFLDKLSQFPQFAAALCQIPSLRQRYPQCIQYAEAVLMTLFDLKKQGTHDDSEASNAALAKNASALTDALLPEALQRLSLSEIGALSMTSEEIDVSTLPGASSCTGENLSKSASNLPPQSTSVKVLLTKSGAAGITNTNFVPPSIIAAPVNFSAGSDTSVVPALAAQKQLPPGSSLQGFGLGQVESLMNDYIMPNNVPAVPVWFSDQIYAIFNSLCSSNVDQRADEIRDSLIPEYYPWLADYAVKTRAAKELNLQSIFIEFIDKLRQSKFFDVVVNTTYDCINSMLKYVEQAKESCSFRTVLKNLGSWLGWLTLARNRPLKSRNMDLKALLFEAYENGWLVAVLPLVCKIMESIKHSKIFKPPNPWTVAVFNLLGEIHQLPNIRTNLVFEIEVLFKNLDLNIVQFHNCTDLLTKRKSPSVNSDFVQGSTGISTSSISASSITSETMGSSISNLAYSSRINTRNAMIGGSLASSQNVLSIASSLAANRKAGTLGISTQSSYTEFGAAGYSSSFGGSIEKSTAMHDKNMGSKAVILPSQHLIGSGKPVSILDNILHSSLAGSNAKLLPSMISNQQGPGRTGQSSSVAGPLGPERNSVTGIVRSNLLQQVPGISQFEGGTNAISASGISMLLGLSQPSQSTSPVINSSTHQGTSSQYPIEGKAIDPLSSDFKLVTAFAPPQGAPNLGSFASQQQRIPSGNFVGASQHLSIPQTDASIPSQDSLGVSEHQRMMITSHTDSLLQNLSNSVIISPSIALFKIQPNLRPVVPMAVDRAIREIISAVVERSVTISCVSTRELVAKDFAMEVEESLVKRAAHLMVASLAGSLALVTCREPLRVSLAQHLRQLLQPGSIKDCNDQVLIEQVVQIISSDNLELGCLLIEQAVVEKALRDIEEAMQPDILARRQAKEKNLHFVDAAYINNNSRWPAALPESLKLRPVLTNRQLQVYKDFMNIGPLKKMHQAANFNAGINLSNTNNSNVLSTQGAINYRGALPQPLHTSGGKIPLEAPQASNKLSRMLEVNRNMNQNLDRSQALLTQQGMRKNSTATDLQSQSQFIIVQPPEPVGIPPVGDLPLQVVMAKLDECLSQLKEIVKDLLSNPPVMPTSPTMDKNNFPPYSSPYGAVSYCEEMPATVNTSLIALACLSSDHEVFSLIQSISDIACTCQQKEEIIVILAQKLFKSIHDVSALSSFSNQAISVAVRAVESANLYMEVFWGILDGLRHHSENLIKLIGEWLMLPGSISENTARKLNITVAAGFVRYRLINIADFDLFLVNQMDHGCCAIAVEFAVDILKVLLLDQRAINPNELSGTLGMLKQIPVDSFPTKILNFHRYHGLSMNDAKTKLILDYSATIFDQSGYIFTITQLINRYRQSPQVIIRKLPAPPIVSDQHRQVIGLIFDEWVRFCSMANSERLTQLQATFFQKISHQGMLRMDENTYRFFSVCVEHAVNSSLMSANTTETSEMGTSVEGTPASTGNLRDDADVVLNENDANSLVSTDIECQNSSFYIEGSSNFLDGAPIVALAKMIVAMMRLVDPSQVSPVTILQKALGVICRIIHNQGEAAKSRFNQRPYFRLLLTLLLEVNEPDKIMDNYNLQCLLSFANHFALLAPTRIPAFAFGWLELISHRRFLPRMLKHVKGWPAFHKLLILHFRFLFPFLKNVALTDSIRVLYNGTLRILLVLLHDFPEFLCDYHFSFCDALPLNCVQLRNLILSAFPRNMKLQDPFMPNLKVDLLPEIKMMPRILSNYSVILLQNNLKSEVDAFWKTMDRNLLPLIKNLLLLNKEESIRQGTKYNISLMNALLLYVGVSLPGRIPRVNQNQIEMSPSLELILYLAKKLDMEGRYLLMSAISNHLRYPNAHTHYFSCLLLWLFGESQDEMVQEQITRVLLERLIVHRPHPWGLLITFIELIKNPRFNFWNCSFVHAAPEVEKLFQSVAQTCLGHHGVQQQQQRHGFASIRTVPSITGGASG